MSKRSLMWVYFLFSIPYGKGKANSSWLYTGLAVSIPYGKGKAYRQDVDSNNYKFQFPMGKVKLL